MDLLPQHHREFGRKDYWDTFFKKREGKAFEWYGEYTELCGVLHKYIRPSDSILVPGCGNSDLSADLIRTGGFRKVVSVDTSTGVIRSMRDKYESLGEKIQFLEMDATKMTFSNESFEIVLDKGTLDALFVDGEDPYVLKTVQNYVSEIDRVLKFNGRYICISLLQPHILQYIVSNFSERGWPVRIVRCKETDANKSYEERVYPVFAFVATKFKKINNGSSKGFCQPVFELASSSEGKITRLKKQEDIFESVRGLQQFAAIKARKRDEADVSLDLRSPESDKPRFSMFVVDRSKDKGSISSKKNKFAVFIVPQGRESEWLFVTEEGRRQLTESACCETMVVVHLHRDHSYSSMDAIQSELSGYALELSPEDLPSNFKIPFLSLGAECLGKRIEKSRGKSELSGEYVVEDVRLSDGKDYRRLIFLSNPNLTQSEARLVFKKTNEKKNKKARQVIDHSYLACAHHSFMIAAMHSFNEAEERCLIIGLGGGALASRVSNKFPNVLVDVVELDPAIIRVAKDYFGFETNSRLNVINADGVNYINGIASEAKGKKYSIVMLDVDNKDSSLGLSCPPKSFVEKGFLLNIKSCLKKTGILIINLVCRDPLLRQTTLEDLKSVFGSLRSYKIPEEVNEILYCEEDFKRKIPVEEPDLLNLIKH